MKKALARLMPLMLIAALLLTACGGGTSSAPASASEPAASTPAGSAPESTPASEPAGDPVTIQVAAAASLEKVFTEQIIPAFNELHPHITIEGVYDSSGKLQTQIEEGLGADVFMSAATKQMNALVDGGYVEQDDIVELLENRIVLIAPADSDTTISSFEEITEAETVALGDPESVPVGQYSKEALESLGIYDEVAAKTSFGTNVTEVLNWVAEGSADVGIVYATDAASTPDVKILAEAPEGALAQKVIYPVAKLAESANAEQAALFVEFLQTPEALAFFTDAGFTPNI